MAELCFDDEDLARQVLARQLRRLREASGRSLTQLASETNYDRTYLNRLENGERLSKLAVMEALDAIYGTGGLLADLWRLAQRDAFKDKYKAFMRYEAKARILHGYSLIVPGLLQTEAYARHLMSSAPSPSALGRWMKGLPFASAGRRCCTGTRPSACGSSSMSRHCGDRRLTASSGMSS